MHITPYRQNTVRFGAWNQETIDTSRGIQFYERAVEAGVLTAVQELLSELDELYQKEPNLAASVNRETGESPSKKLDYLHKVLKGGITGLKRSEIPQVKAYIASLPHYVGEEWLVSIIRTTGYYAAD